MERIHSLHLDQSKDALTGEGLRAYINIIKKSGAPEYRFGYNNGTSTYSQIIPTNDTYGKFRIRRFNFSTGSPVFNLYYWNNTGNNWVSSTLGNSGNISIPNSPRTQYIQIKPGAEGTTFGRINVTIDDFYLDGDINTYGIFNTIEQLGRHNVSIFVNDTYGFVNDTEETYFNITASNVGPSKPFVMTPDSGDTIKGIYNITWTPVSDPEGDNLRFNITLLNSDKSVNSSIVTDYGNANSTYYDSWDTTLHADGLYNIKVTVYENETITKNYDSDDLDGNFTIDNTPPTYNNAINTSDTFKRYDNFTANITINDNIQLGYYIFSTNASGSWQNKTISVSSTEYNASEQANISLPKGNTICWYYWFNDTAGNENNSYTYCFTVVNTAPTTPTTLILNSPKVGENLTAICSGSTDNDLDTITYYYEFNNTNDNTIISAWGTNNNYTIQSSDAHDTIKVTCGAYDGTVYSTANITNTTTVQNSAPNVTYVNVTPDAAYTTDNLLLNITCTDIDNSTIIAYWEWYNNSNLIASLSGSISLPNNSNTLLHTVASGNTTKGNSWEAKVWCVDGINNSSARYDNVTILNTAPTAPTSITTAPPTVYTDTTVTCTASGSSDVDNDAITYLYKFNDTAGTLQDWTATNTFSCNTAGCDKGDTLYCRALASTSDANSTTNSNSTTILNSAPVASDVQIKPDNPVVTDNLTCNYTYSDVDTDAESGTTFKWFKNDALQASLTSNTVTSGNLSNGDFWICEVKPSDGTANGTAVNSTAKEIGSTAPSIITVTDNSNSSYPTNVGNNITFWINWNDPDVGQPERIYVCNTSNISSGGCADMTFCYTSNSADNPQTCNYTAQQSDNTTVPYYTKICDNTSKCSASAGPYTFDVNHAPNLTTNPNITPTTAYTHTILTCNNGNFSDQDGDSQGTHTYRWFDSGALISGQTSTTLDCGAVVGCDKGDLIICEQTPFDMHNFAGAPKNSSAVTILNSAPTINVTEPDGINDVVIDSYIVTWTASDNDTDIITVSCYADADNVGYDKTYACFTGTANDGTELCDTSSWITGNYYIWCNATDGTDYGTGYSSGQLTVDHTGPTIGTPTATPSIINQTQTTNTTVNITDNVNVSTAIIQIIYPNTTSINITMTKDGGNTWYYAFSDTYQPGIYNYNLYSNDTQNNWNSAGPYTFIVNDVTVPAVTDLSSVPATANQSQTITVAANVTDYYWNSVDVVLANVSYDATYTLVTLTSNGTNYVGVFTNTTWVGQYNVTIIANDTSGNINNTEKTNFTVNDVTSPVIISTIPTNGTTLAAGTTSETILLTTNETAECRYGNASDVFSNMTEFTNTNSTSHNFTVTSLTDGSAYNYYFLCQDNYGNIMTSKYLLRFSIGTVQPPPSHLPIVPPTNVTNVTNVTTNVTPPVNVTVPEVTLGEHLHEPNGTAINTSVRDSIDVNVLEGAELHYIITNIFNKTLTNVSLSAEFPETNETPQSISYTNRIGWGLEWLTGWSIVSDVLEPSLMRWELESSGVIDKLEPNESVHVPIIINTPLTKLDSGKMVLDVYSNNVKLFNRTVLLNIAKNPVIIVGDYHNDTQTSDIYISLNRKDIANSTDVMIEFSINDGKNTVIYDYFGPYNADSQGKILIAQKYHFGDQIDGKVYDMHIRAYNGLAEIGEASGKLDLTNKTVV